MAVSVASLGLVVSDRRGLLPQRRLRPDAAARARSGGHAHRRDRGAIRRDRARNPQASFPPARWTRIIDNIGLPNSWDQPGAGRHPDHLERRRRDPDFAQSREARSHPGLRSACSASACSEKFPDMTFFFKPANITTQILNFGLPAPIDLQVVGRDATRQLQDRRASCGEDFARIPARPTFTSTRWSISRRSA